MCSTVQCIQIPETRAQISEGKTRRKAGTSTNTSVSESPLLDPYPRLAPPPPPSPSPEKLQNRRNLRGSGEPVDGVGRPEDDGEEDERADEAVADDGRDHGAQDERQEAQEGGD